MSTLHPDLEGRPVLLGDELEATVGTTTVRFIVGAVALNRPGGAFGTHTVFTADLELDFPLEQCRRVDPA